MKTTLKNVRLSYPKLKERVSFNGSEPKFETQLLIPKANTELVALIEQTCEEAVDYDLTRGAKSQLKTRPKTPLSVLKDGDLTDNEAAHDHWILVAKNKDVPKLVTHDRVLVQPQDSGENFYGGRYVTARIDIYPYSVGKKGLTCRLEGLLDLGNGEPFGAGAESVEEMFDLDGLVEDNGILADFE